MLNYEGKRYAIFLLVKPDVGAYSWMDFDRYESLIEAGEQAAQARLPEIRRTLRRGQWAFQIQRLRERLTDRRRKN
jgi:hypothetical protein